MADEIGSVETGMAAAAVERSVDWAGLPAHILDLIIKRLFLTDMMQFHRVCKAWRSIPAPPTQPQCLMTMSKDNKQCKFFQPGCTQYYSSEIPELTGAEIHCSNDGWLLLSRDHRSFFFFSNPFTKQFIKLPNFPQNMHFSTMTFTSSPTRSDCIVFGIYGWEDVVRISTIRRGEGEWKILYHLENNLPFSLSRCNAVFHHGMFYCLGKEGNLGVFDPESSTWNVCRNPTCPPSVDRYSIGRSFLVECNKELIAVFLGDGLLGKWISVFKLNDEKTAWERVESLGDQLLLLSNKTSLSRKRMGQGMENKIYLPAIRQGRPVYYPIGEITAYHAFGQHHSRKDLNGTTDYMHATWIEPNVNTYSVEQLKWATFDHDSDERPLIDLYALYRLLLQDVDSESE